MNTESGTGEARAQRASVHALNALGGSRLCERASGKKTTTVLQSTRIADVCEPLKYFEKYRCRACWIKQKAYNRKTFPLSKTSILSFVAPRFAVSRLFKILMYSLTYFHAISPNATKYTTYM